jgi:hypothetical protein
MRSLNVPGARHSSLRSRFLLEQRRHRVWGWYGYRGCGYGHYAPRVYGHAYRSHYRPQFGYGEFYRPLFFGWRGWSERR